MWHLCWICGRGSIPVVGLSGSCGADEKQIPAAERKARTKPLQFGVPTHVDASSRMDASSRQSERA